MTLWIGLFIGFCIGVAVTSAVASVLIVWFCIFSGYLPDPKESEDGE